MSLSRSSSHTRFLVTVGGLALLAGGLRTSADVPPAAAPPAAAPAPARVQTPPRFESEIAAFEAADRKNPPPPGAVLFLGSSSIRFWTTAAQDFPELTVLNRGFGGSFLAESTRYAPRIVLPARPRMIVLYAGTNDIDSGEAPAQVAADFRAFVAEIHAALPATRIAYISINPSVARWREESQVLEANRLIAAYVRANDGKPGKGGALKLSFLDTHAKLLGPDGQPRPEILRADGLHLNAQGYALWTALLRPQILALAGPEKK